MQRLTIIVPTLNEAALIVRTLQSLAPLRARGAGIIIADGGSTDGTVPLARALADAIVTVRHGRGAAMNAAAQRARGDALVFLHADTLLPRDADALIAAALAQRAWGRFDIRIAGRHPLLALIARLINWRSRLTGVASGDQAMFVRRAAFLAAGGFPDLPMLEDIAMARRLKRLCRPACIATPAVTSGRRWDHHGVVRTVVLMWVLRLAYYLGVAPARLRLYYGPAVPLTAQRGARP
jgi:rSAM/selenodomain-associated transferase 2